MNQWVRSVRALTLVESKLYLRQPAAVFFGIAFPVLLLLLFGYLFGDLPLSASSEYRVVDFYLPALIGAFIGQAGLIGLPIFLASYRELGILKRYQASPVSLETYLFAHTTVQFFALLASALLMMAVGAVIFGSHFPNNVGLVLLAALISIASFFAVGFALSGLLPTPQTAQAVGNFLFLTMFFLSGAAIPREVFPDWLATASTFLPMTHAVTSLSGLWLGEPLSDHLLSLGILVGMGVVATLVARRVFKWQR